MMTTMTMMMTMTMTMMMVVMMMMMVVMMMMVMVVVVLFSQKFNDTVNLTKNNTDVARNGKEHQVKMICSCLFLPFGILWQCHKFVMV